jgi:hypothetical protein
MRGAATAVALVESHDARSFEGIAIRVARRVLALAAAVWHNHRAGQAVSRSLTACNHEELLV